MSSTRGKLLFLFAKHYPYGNMEKYLEHELPFLAEQFDRIVLVPFEYFHARGKPEETSLLPHNAEVLDLNKLVQQSGRKAWTVLGQAMGIWLYEFIHNPFRRFQLRHFSKNKNVLLYQLISSRVFEHELRNYAGYDLYFYSYWFHHSALLLAALKSRRSIQHFVSRAHSIDLYNENWLYADDVNKPLPYYHYKMKYVDRIVAISKHGQNYLRNRFPSDHDKIAQAYLGVNSMGNGQCTPQTPLVIVSCSNFTENKRVHCIAEILGKVKFRVKWVHFGDGGPGKERVMQLVRNLPSNVEVDLRGFTPNREILRYYQHNPVHLIMNMSKAEGVPVSIMEAISFGIPVLATAVYGTVELGTEDSAYFVPVDYQEEQVIAWLTRYEADLEWQASMRAAARKHFLETVEARTAYSGFIEKYLLPFRNSVDEG